MGRDCRPPVAVRPGERTVGREELPPPLPLGPGRHVLESWLERDGTKRNFTTTPFSVAARPDGPRVCGVPGRRPLACDRGLYYVDVGFRDDASPTYALDVDHGWRGLCVDVEPSRVGGRACRVATDAVADVDGASLAGQLGRALSHAHGKGVLHSDVKPENLLVQKAPKSNGSRPQWHLRLADFGLAAATPGPTQGRKSGGSLSLQSVS